MPKDEIDPEDPLELHGVALMTHEDTSESMSECFIEEFMRLGHSPARILALFRNRHYTGPNMVLQNRGEDFVKDKIVEVFGWWGVRVERRVGAGTAAPTPEIPGDSRAPCEAPEAEPVAQTLELDPEQIDPGGAAVPRINL